MSPNKMLLGVVAIIAIQCCVGGTCCAADQLPPPWVGSDIGSPSLAGGSVFYSDYTTTGSYHRPVGGYFNVLGAGTDIWGSSDQFHFVYQEIEGDGQIVARIYGQTNTSASAKAGIMVRESLAANANFTDIVAEPYNSGTGKDEIVAYGRPSGVSNWYQGTGSVYWLKLVRSGGYVYPYVSLDNGQNGSSAGPTSWQLVGGGYAINPSAPAYFGLCVTSNNTSAISTAALDNVTLTNQQATSADDFVNSIGVCTHLSFGGVYSNLNTVETLLSSLGVRHIRDSVYAGDQQSLAKLGITTCAIVGPPAAGNYANSDLVSMVNTVASDNTPLSAVDLIEGPNEPDGYWPNTIYYNNVSWNMTDGGGATAWARDLYTAVRANSNLSHVPILGMALGTAWANTPPYTNPLLNANPSLANSVDYANCHPYPGGNTNPAWPMTYDTIPEVGSSYGYWWYGSEPSDVIDEWPNAFQDYSAAYGNKPMCATETGYFTASPNGAANGSVSQPTFAKYTPRLFAEFFRRGFYRTYECELIDRGTISSWEQNLGLVYNNLTVKPAYTTLQSLIALLSEKGADFVPDSLNYTVNVSANGSYTKTELVHHILLEKSNGTFYLLLWHEVASSASANTSGAPITGLERDISPPAMATTITLGNFTGTASLYTYNTSYKLVSAPLAINSGVISLSVPDQVVIVQLTPD